jgi:4-hydroxy-3-methylbut-2-enyl diphosphate reductase
MAEKAIKGKDKIYSLGSIIHNKDVVRRLSEKGLKVVSDIDEVKEGTVVISSHGISPKTARMISKRGLKIIDTTCPFVRTAQETVKKLANEGYALVVVGDSGHPEIKALLDFAPGDVFVVRNKEEASRLSLTGNDRVSVISQTTQSVGNFVDVVKTISERVPKELRAYNTICNDAGSRQDEARRLASRVDLMLVVGGKDSANTKRLVEVCSKVLGNSHLVETEDDIQSNWFKGVKTVGITSGASTPDWVIKRVVKKSRERG